LAGNITQDLALKGFQFSVNAERIARIYYKQGMPMKKRNRLLSSSQQSKLFKSESLSPHKNRHITILSLLALTGIFITGIVLATSEPQLPNMPDDAESTTSSLETSIKLPSPSSSESSPSADIVSIQEEQPVTTNAALQESAEIERLHLNQPKAASENESDIIILNDALSESPADNVTASDELSWQEVEVKSVMYILLRRQLVMMQKHFSISNPVRCFVLEQ
jgi:hypothetical protein